MSIPVSLTNLANLQNDITATNAINSNNDAITTALVDALSRSGSTPNTMSSSLDMNSNNIINLPDPATANSPLRLQDLSSFVGGGTVTNIPAGGSAGQVIVKESSSNYDVGWGNNVSSVGLALPADFTITNSPVTSTGTLTGAWALTPTGTGAVVRATSPTLVTPALGTPASGVATNLTGTAAGLTAGHVTTNANLTGPITSSGNATSVAAQTGTGSTFVMNTSPTLVTPTLGVASATSVNKVAITTPATGSTLTIADSKTLTSNNSLVLSGNDNASIAFQGSDTYVGRATTDTFTNKTFDTAGTGNSFKISGNSITATTGSGSVVLSNSPALVTPGIGAATGSGLAISGNTSTISVNSGSATALTVGLNAPTNPAFQVDTSVGLQVAGLKVTGAVTGGTVAVAAIDSGAATNLTLNAKGTGTIGIGNVSSGAVTITPNVTHSGTSTLSGALTYGGVTLSNAVTGTGNMVLATSPTLTTPTLGAATVTTVNGLTITPSSSTTLTIPNSSTITLQGTDTYVGRNTTDTLSNKTLVAPALGAATATSINGLTITPASGTLAISGSNVFNVSNSLTLAGTNGTTLTFQASDTYVGRGTTDTLTNKTIDSSTNTLGSNDNKFTLHNSTDATKQAVFSLSGVSTGTTRTLTVPDASTTIVGTDATQTLTNKSIAATQLTGTLAAGQFPALTGDITTSAGALATTIATNGVSNAKFRQGAGLSVVGVTGSSTANVADITGIANQALRVNSAGTALAFGAIDLSQSASATGILQAASHPALTGDVTNTSGTLATTIANNAVTNAKAAQMAAKTVKMNATSGTANATDTAISALTDISTPNTTLDWLLIEDHTSGTLKKTNASELVSALGSGVTTYNGRNGTVTATGTDIPLRGYLSGLTLSTAGSSSTFSISAGVSTDSTNVSMMSIAAFTKTTGSWALGTAAGSLDTGAIATSTWYHVFQIQRPDTGVVDILTSLSATSPTMPTNYTLFRRIGSMKTDGSSNWTAFNQNGDLFQWVVPLHDINTSNIGTAATDYTITVPTGVQVAAQIWASVFATGVASVGWIYAKTVTDQTVAYGTFSNVRDQSAGNGATSALSVMTDTSAKVRAKGSVSGATFDINTAGWLDTRGKN